jgi:hypothetical protein
MPLSQKNVQTLTSLNLLHHSVAMKDGDTTQGAKESAFDNPISHFILIAQTEIYE